MDVKDRILDAAEACYRKYGVRKTTMDDVAAGAAVSRPTLYRYLGNRDDIVRAVLLRHFAAFSIRGRQALDLLPTFEEKIVGGTIIAVTAATRDAVISEFYGPDSVEMTSRIVGSSDVLLRGTIDLWGPVLQAGIDFGEARSDLDVEETCRWLLEVQFILTSRLGGRREIDVESMRADIRDFVLPGIVSATGI